MAKYLGVTENPQRGHRSDIPPPATGRSCEAASPERSGGSGSLGRLSGVIAPRRATACGAGRALIEVGARQAR
jgi:hypothetical protein